MEALFQGAAKGAKGMLERGEKWGINQAVRDAMGEIRRNMQTFNESRHLPRPPREILSDQGAATALAAMERRNLQLASVLDDTVTSLKAISTTNLDDKTKSLELIKVAAAKVQFVKIYLEDSSMEVPIVDRPAPEDDKLETDEQSIVEEPGEFINAEPDVDEAQIPALSLREDVPVVQTDAPNSPPSSQAKDTTGIDSATDHLSETVPAATRPPTVPTRSTLAQSSFSWMLEPNETSPTQPRSERKSPPTSSHKKQPSNNASREKNAFLFGEVTTETDGKYPLRMDDIFGMETLRKKK